MEKSKNPAKEIQEVLRRLERIKVGVLPVETLEHMDVALQKKQSALLERTNALEIEIHSRLIQGEVDVLKILRFDMQRLKQEYDELVVDRKRIYDGLQQRILRNNLINKLGSEKRVIRFEQIVIILIIFILGLIFYDIIIISDPKSVVSKQIFFIDVSVCVIFLTEFFLLYSSAEDKRWFWRRHWITFLSSIPFPPNILYARLVRLLRLMRLIRVFRIFLFFWQGRDTLNNIINLQIMKRTIQIVVMIILVGGISIHYVEKDAMDTIKETYPDDYRNQPEYDPNIKSVENLRESIWWSFTTVLSLGYASHYNPHTFEGRVITMILVTTGIALIGVVIATLTSLYIKDNSEEIARHQGEQDEKLERLGENFEEKLDQLAKKVETLSTQLEERR